MAGVTLARSDLTEAQLVGADLRYSICHGAIFDKADLHHANLWNIDLGSSSAKETIFCKCWLGNSNLVDADIRGADFSGAWITAADLSNSLLAGST